MTPATMTEAQANALLDRFCATNDMHPVMGASVSQAAQVGAMPTGVFPGVRRGLSEVGFSPLAIVLLIPKIIELITEFGPQATDLVTKVVARLREIFGK